MDAAFQASALVIKLAQIATTGDLSVFASSAKRQHFVPQFVLSGFAEQVGSRELLWQHDIETRAMVRVDIASAASRRHFYSFLDDAGERDTRIEGFLALVESEAAGPFATLLGDPLSLAQSDRATLSLFFALQSLRTPGSAAAGAAAGDTVMRLLVASSLRAGQEFRAAYQQVSGNSDPSESEVEAFRQQMLQALSDGTIGFADPGEQALHFGISMAPSQAALIFDSHWTVIRCSGAFVTSDRAIAMFDPTPAGPWTGSALRSSPAAETTFPLSSDACLLSRPGPAMTAEADVALEMADLLNLRTLGWAEGYVFARDEATIRRICSVADTSPADVVRPRIGSQILLIDADPDDRSIADRNEAQGWPRHVTAGGEPHDYFVVPHGTNPVELSAEIELIVRARARRKLGLGPNDPLPGRSTLEPLAPWSMEE